MHSEKQISILKTKVLLERILNPHSKTDKNLHLFTPPQKNPEKTQQTNKKISKTSWYVPDISHQSNKR